MTYEEKLSMARKIVDNCWWWGKVRRVTKCMFCGNWIAMVVSHYGDEIQEVDLGGELHEMTCKGKTHYVRDTGI